jgi:hypothetical protein
MDYTSIIIGMIIAIVAMVAIIKYNPQGYGSKIATLANKENYAVYGIKDRVPLFNGPGR